MRSRNPMLHLRVRTAVIAAFGAVLLVFAVPIPASAATSTAYDSIPAVLPPSFPSLGYEATQTAEFGEHLQLAGTDRTLEEVTVSLTSWACETGAWNLGTCVTTPGATFTHPVTLTLYEVDSSGVVPVVGPVLATLTQPVDVPFRPSADATNCPAATVTQWFDPGTHTCNNGFAFLVLFDLSASGAVLPDEVIVSIAYDTQSYGASPIGSDGPYNALNVSLASAGPSIGTDVDPDAMFWNTSTAGNYADGGAGGVATFRQDTDWSPYTLALRIVTSSLDPAPASPAATLPAPASPAATLAATGVDGTSLAIVGAILLSAGIGIVVVLNRRGERQANGRRAA